MECYHHSTERGVETSQGHLSP